MIERKYPIGAEVTERGVHFRVWSPKCTQVEVINDVIAPFSLVSEGNGYFSGLKKGLKDGMLYGFRLDGQEKIFPDPFSRSLPHGPHEKTQIIDPKKFDWKDWAWKGVIDKEKVILYELHIGTFTNEGTWQSARKKLPYLAELGINVIEMMPVAEFPGNFNWGYDGVSLFSPTHLYGTPDDLRAFINQAHLLGIGVILDVVYNHFGPDGNYTGAFSDDYLKDSITEWGKAINFQKKEVREFYITNATYWIEEFHFDGLRFDACHAIEDESETHILADIARNARNAVPHRSLYFIAENESQQIHLALPESEGGYDLDAVWNEDFHHTAVVRMTHSRTAYYYDYLGTPQEFVSSIKHGFLYQGQWYTWQDKNRGSPSLSVSHEKFVNFLENHDQVANMPSSLRLHLLSDLGIFRALTTLFLLSPQIPLLFQGQEFGSKRPFYYFSDQKPELAEKVFQGRQEFLSQFKRSHESIPLPQSQDTFEASKLDWEMDDFLYRLHIDLIACRKHDPFFSDLKNTRIEGAVLNENAFLLRYIQENEERLLIFNLGQTLFLNPAPEPLLAPPPDCEWFTFFSSEDEIYGGECFENFSHKGVLKLKGPCATILTSKKRASHEN